MVRRCAQRKTAAADRCSNSRELMFSAGTTHGAQATERAGI